MLDELAPRPSQPPLVASYGLMNLWDMLNLLFGNLYVIARMLRDHAEKLDPSPTEDRTILFDLLRKHIMESLPDFGAACREIGLLETAKRVTRITEKLERPLTKADAPRVAEWLRDLLVMMEDEGDGRAIYVIEKRKTEWLHADPDPWQSVYDRFNAATPDIQNALMCHSLEQDTACVFHLMRVLEHGLEAMAQEVGRTFDRQQWHNIIEEIESAITALRKAPRSPERDAQLQFLSEAAKEFFYFKDGWRNYVTHKRAIYDENQARSMIEHVRAFMTVLAEKVPRKT